MADFGNPLFAICYLLLPRSSLDELLYLFHRGLAGPHHEHTRFFLKHHMPSVFQVRSRGYIGVPYRVRTNDDCMQEFAGGKMEAGEGGRMLPPDKNTTTS